MSGPQQVVRVGLVLENDTRDILVTNYEDVGRVRRVHEDVTRMLRRRYEETASVKFTLYDLHDQVAL